ncbi:MAG: helix-turn-helix domain-containing protein [Evtepia sp.]
MLVCTLSVLMAERGLKISDVSRETGISRTTLTSLSNNNCTGVQLETMNTLCRYLNVQPGELFSFEPVDVDITKFNCLNDSVHFNENSVSYSEIDTFSFSTGWKCGELMASFLSDVEATYNPKENTLSVDLHFSLKDTEDKDVSDVFLEIMKKLPRQFVTIIEKDFAYSHAAISAPMRDLIDLSRKSESSSSLKMKYTIHWPE